MARVNRLAPSPSRGRASDPVAATQVGRAESAALSEDRDRAPDQGLVRRLTRWLRRGNAADGMIRAGEGTGSTAGLSGARVRQGDAIVPFGASGRAPRVLMAVMIGLDADALERTLAAISVSSGRAEGLIETLCLTDCPRFELFRRRGLLFEYLPAPREQARFAPDLDWDLYTLRRLARLRRKWNPVRIVAFGQAARAQLDAWRTSPFEDESIKALIRSPEPPGGAGGAIPPTGRD